MMKNPRNLLVFAAIGGAFGLGIGIVAGRLSVPQPKYPTLEAPDVHGSVMLSLIHI